MTHHNGTVLTKGLDQSLYIPDKTLHPVCVDPPGFFGKVITPEIRCNDSETRLGQRW
jgi:hypothetical protein